MTAQYVKRLLLLMAMFYAANAHAGERILALAPHVCEILFAIEAGPDIVGAVNYCDYPAAAKDIPHVGTYQRINVESALRLEPTMVVVMNREVPGVSQLEQLGVKVIESYPDSFDGIFSDIRKLGKATGREKEAELLVSRLGERLAKVRAHKRESVSVFYEVWFDPLITAGGQAFITEVLHEAGARNVFAAVSQDTPQVNVEAVLQARPQVIIIPSENRDVHARQSFWESWFGQNKVKFVEVNPDLMHRPGPRLFDGLEALQEALRKVAGK